MKKNILILLLLVVSICKSQTWKEDFELCPSQSLPLGWLQNNIDGNTVVYNHNLTFGFWNDAWVTYFDSQHDPSHGVSAISTSFYQSGSTSNDWLITHSFVVPTNGRLRFETWSADVQDSYFVAISNSGTLTTSFTTTLLNVPSIVTGWTTQDLNLSGFTGQTVRIAFVNNSTGRLLLKMDNIEVYSLPNTDGSIKELHEVKRYSATTQTVSGYFKSFGLNQVNNAVLNYNVNGGAIITQTMNFGSPLNYGDSSKYTFTSPAGFTVGINHINIWLSQVNGLNETRTNNDSLEFVVYAASKVVQRNALFEYFDSPGCPPSDGIRQNFAPLLNLNGANTGGKLNVIKYNTVYGDPGFSTPAIKRLLYYNNKPLLPPEVYANGTKRLQSYTQSDINAALNSPTGVNMVAALKTSSNVVTASSTITPYFTISNSPLKIVHALTQKYYYYPGISSFPGTEHHYHVMRKMNPDSAIVNFTPVDGVTVSTSFNYTATVKPIAASQDCFDFWQTAGGVEYEYVVFVQDTLTKDVIQSSSAIILDTTSIGIVEYNADKKMGIYPNPAADYVTVGLKLTEVSDIDVCIYNQSGQEVYANKSRHVLAGKPEMNINTSELTSGIYFIYVKTSTEIFKEKLVIAK